MNKKKLLIKAKRTLKHLQGRHDQKTHGNRKAGLANSEAEYKSALKALAPIKEKLNTRLTVLKNKANRMSELMNTLNERNFTKEEELEWRILYKEIGNLGDGINGLFVFNGAIREAINDYENEASPYLEKTMVYHAKQAAKIRESIGDDFGDDLDLSVSSTSGIDFDLKHNGSNSQVNTGVNAYKNLVGNGLTGDYAGIVPLNSSLSNIRASHNDGKIEISSNDTSGVVVHELGHWLENISDFANNKTVEFLNKRTANEPTISLRKATGNSNYGEEEVTKVDKFISPYMGKIYRSFYGKQNTEILSIGLQMFHETPTTLALADPDYFDFIYAIVRAGT